MSSRRPFRSSRRLGQNFLVDPNIARNIVDLAHLSGPNAHVLEIGSGFGSLTTRLLDHPAKPFVRAVEVDHRLAADLEESLADQPRFTLLRADILSLSADQAFEGADRWTVVTNAPYSISGALLRWLMNSAESIERAVVMLQSEVVERIQASPGTKDYGVLGVAISYYFRVDKRMNVSPSCFRPRPRVGSSVISLVPHPEPPIDVKDVDLFMQVLKRAFGQRRKTLRNALGSGATDLPGGPEALVRAFEITGIDPGLRAERLTLEDFGHLADALSAP